LPTKAYVPLPIS